MIQDFSGLLSAVLNELVSCVFVGNVPITKSCYSADVIFLLLLHGEKTSGEWAGKGTKHSGFGRGWAGMGME